MAEVWLFMNNLIVFAKYPEPGNVKTRIGEKIGMEKASKLYHHFLLDAFEQYSYLGKTSVKVYFSPENRLVKEYRRLLPNQFHLKFQMGNDLGSRMKNAFADELFHGSCMIIGTDHPNLPSKYIKDGFAFLNSNPGSVVIGKSSDGGFYTLGMNVFYSQLFEGMTYSHQNVYSQAMNKIKLLGIDFLELPEWYDIDVAEDLSKLVADVKKEIPDINIPKRTIEFMKNQQLYF